jgi:hypothetical protein
VGHPPELKMNHLQTDLIKMSFILMPFIFGSFFIAELKSSKIKINK